MVKKNIFKKKKKERNPVVKERKGRLYFFPLKKKKLNFLGDFSGGSVGKIPCS